MKKHKIKPENLMTAENYAKMIGVTKQTVYLWVRKGKLDMVTFLGKSFVDITTRKENKPKRKDNI